MTSYISEYSLYRPEVNAEPEWAKAERLAYCEISPAGKRDAGFMDSLRTLFGRIFR